MIANARMYSVTTAVGLLWRQLLEGVIERADRAVEIVDWPAPLPLHDLWDREDKAAVFMCGLPFSLACPQPDIVAAPVPALARSGARPLYCSDLVVRDDSSFGTLPDTFGQRIAFTDRLSQSGFAGVLDYLMQFAQGEPLYREVVPPRITPYGALRAVTDGLAEITAIDSWAFALMQRHAPALTERVRVIASTELHPIPLLTASPGAGNVLASSFLEAHDDAALRVILDQLLIDRFVRPLPDSYAVLARRFEAALRFWRRQPLAETTDPAFAI